MNPPPELNQEKVLAALGNKLRWQMFRMLSGGTPMHAAMVAKKFDRDFDGISKHLRILRSAGLLRSRRATDRRVEQYFVPAEFRQVEGHVELGFCLLRIPESSPDRVEKPVPKPADESIEEEEILVQGFGEMLANSAAIGPGRNE